MRRAHRDDHLLLVFDVDCLAADGALYAARWFQLQPSTAVAVTDVDQRRTHANVRAAVHELGHKARMQVPRDLVRAGPPADAAAAFTRDGCRVIAVVARDPATLESVPGDGDVARVVADTRVDLSSLMGDDDLPPQVALVWHGLNDTENLQKFLASDVEWGECDVRRDTECTLVLRHDEVASGSDTGDPCPLTLDEALGKLAADRRRVKLDLKEGDGVVEEMLASVAAHGWADEDLWFNASIDVLGADGFAALRAARPGAMVQCPADFLVPLLRVAPRRAAGSSGCSPVGASTASPSTGATATWSACSTPCRRGATP
jgi:hypothetical protein